VLKAASESKRSDDFAGLPPRDAGHRSVRIADGRFGFEKRANHHPAAQRESHHNATAYGPSGPGQPLLSEKRVLRSWLAERCDASDFVFTSQKGGRIHRSQFFRMFQSVAERAGLPADRRHPHCLKHALGFSLVAANVNLACVKVALGHKSIASTAIYAVPTDEQVGKAVNAALASLY